MRFNREIIIRQLRELASEGLACHEAAARLGVSAAIVSRYVRHNGIPMRSTGMRDVRAIEVCGLGAEFEANRDIRFISEYGCGYSDFKKLSGYTYQCFLKQRLSAKKRGIFWELNLWQWWTIWRDSGHWHERGCRHDQYVMCRFHDIGPYSASNVFIATARENSSVSPRKKTDLPMGVQKIGDKYQAARRYNGRSYYLGLFSTPEIAHQAYLTFLEPAGSAV